MSLFYFLPFGSTRYQDLCKNFNYGYDSTHSVLFWDQEPLIKQNFDNLQANLIVHPQSSKRVKFLANSEISLEKQILCRTHNYLDWYYFYHGFAALDWYRDYQYLPTVEKQFTKVFINLNRLTTKDRSYRLLLVSKMLEKNIVKFGHVSLSLTDHGLGYWRDELNDPNTKLAKDQLELIENQIGKLSDSLVVDNKNPQGNLSAYAGPNELALNQSALWHVVSETVFYYDKLHLTEKIFKPIVSRRPFILVAAPGNLAYLKSYGFKTFDRWIDESYDHEKDSTLRIEMVVTEIEKLCKLSIKELKKMHKEMQEILDYNFNHMYTNFKDMIIDELVDNFSNAMHIWNHGKFADKQLDISHIDLENVKLLLKS